MTTALGAEQDTSIINMTVTLYLTNKTHTKRKEFTWRFSHKPNKKVLILVTQGGAGGEYNQD